jgi:hypothetical protein
MISRQAILKVTIRVSADRQKGTKKHLRRPSYIVKGAYRKLFGLKILFFKYHAGSLLSKGLSSIKIRFEAGLTFWLIAS